VSFSASSEFSTVEDSGGGLDGGDTAGDGRRLAVGGERGRAGG
jgi:hypothetical protein